jgi:hypothetical protein
LRSSAITSTFTVTVYLRDDDSASSSYSTTATVTVASGALSLTAAAPLTTTEGQLLAPPPTTNPPASKTDEVTTLASKYLVKLADFVDPNADLLPGAFTVTVDWHDGGATDTALVTRVSAGHYSVWDTHVYQQSGTYQAEVDVYDPDTYETYTTSTTVTVAASPITTSNVNLYQVNPTTPYQPVEKRGRDGKLEYYGSQSP